MKYLGPAAKAANHRQKPRRRAGQPIRHKQPPRIRRREPALKAVQRRPVKRVSRKMAKLKAYYYDLRNEFLAENTVCQVHGGRCIATEVHHARGRAGSLLIDARFWQAVCSGGHAWIHDKVADARADGHLCRPGSWNHPPRDAETRRLEAIIKEITK